ncbi:MAG: tetratricopeptide repeat protein [Desulfovibrio sp.]|jgi:tetratricopeptide (TPR) repeat protein|nr:tetratricopeptide repeat protein [Desulfovibrio sp.]
MDTMLDYEINKEMAESYLFIGDFDKAESYYEKAAKANANGADAYMGLATIAVQRGQINKAMKLYKKAVEIKPSDKALCGMGLVYMEQGRHDKAMDHFQRALRLAPGNMVALNCLVREAYSMGRVAAALPYLEAALETGVEQEAVSVTLAGCLICLGKGAQARRHLEAVLRINPSNEDARDLIQTMAA